MLSLETFGRIVCVVGAFHSWLTSLKSDVQGKGRMD